MKRYDSILCVIEIDRPDRKMQAKRDVRRLKNVDDLTRLVAERAQDTELQERTLDAIDGGFEELMRLFKDGGIITVSGKIFPKSISDKMAFVQTRQYYREKLIISSAELLISDGGIDIDALGIKRNSKVVHVNAGFEENLLYRDLPQGRVAVHRNGYYHHVASAMDNLMYACANFFSNLLELKGVRMNDMVSSNIAVRTLMVDIARHWGGVE